MTKRFEKIYGYWSTTGVPKKVAKISGKRDANNYLLELSVIQYDMRIMHFSLHNTSTNSKTTRYHIQADYPDMFGSDDRKTFPKIINSPLPDFRSHTKVYGLQAIPIHAHADDERDFYPIMSASELRRFSDNMADFRQFKFDRHTPGIIDFYLVPEGAVPELYRFQERIHSKYGDKVCLLNIYKDVVPWVLCYVTQHYVQQHN
jgi:hypothetical protein